MTQSHNNSKIERLAKQSHISDLASNKMVPFRLLIHKNNAILVEENALRK